MTYDGTGNLVIAYNHLHLPEKISRNDTLLVKYAYLSDGMKASTLNTAGTGLVYRGSMSFRKDSQGVLSFESAPIATGHITSNGVRYHVTDHLGSIRAVVDGASGALYEASDYAAYGVRSDASNLPNNLSVSTLPAGEAPSRWHFTGQEDQGTVSASAALVPNPANATLPYTDFGARHYSPTLRRWLVPDPLSEKYYDVSPYAYCAGDPVNLVDVGGDSLAVLKTEGQHLALLIQGEDKKWYYYSINGVNVNPSGHFKGGKQVNDKGDLSFDSPQAFLNSEINTDVSPSGLDKSDPSITGYVYTQAYVIDENTDDATARLFFGTLCDNDEYPYSLNPFTPQQCATAVQQTLGEIGVIDKKPRDRYNYFPSKAFKEIMKTVKGHLFVRNNKTVNN